MRRVEIDKKKKIQDLDRLPGDRFIKPFEILLFVVLVVIILFIVFPEEKKLISHEKVANISEQKVEKIQKILPETAKETGETKKTDIPVKKSVPEEKKVQKPKNIAVPSSSIKKEKKVSRFSLEYIKNLLKTTEYSKKETVLREYIKELLSAGKVDLAFDVLEKYKAYIKNPEDYLYLRYTLLKQKYLKEEDKDKKEKIRKRMEKYLNRIYIKGKSNIDTIKLVYTEAYNFGFQKLIEKSLLSLIELDNQNKEKWINDLITFYYSNQEYDKLSQTLEIYADVVSRKQNYLEKRDKMQYIINILLGIHDYDTLEKVIRAYKDEFIYDPEMIKFLIKASLMADKPELAAEISRKFMEEGSR